jgi:6-phosphogluconate dehydrogenase
MGKNIAVVGMAVMGRNLALNMADHAYSVLVYNRTTEVAKQVIDEYKHPNLYLSETLEDMVSRLEKPRKILLMVKAGNAVDALLSQLESLLE